MFERFYAVLQKCYFNCSKLSYSGTSSGLQCYQNQGKIQTQGHKADFSVTRTKERYKLRDTKQSSVLPEPREDTNSGTQSGLQCYQYQGKIHMPECWHHLTIHLTDVKVGG